MVYRSTILWIAGCALCLEWTRLAGSVKSINLKTNVVTIENRDGDLLVVPIDYQVKIMDKHGELRELSRLALDEKITMTRTLMEKPPEDTKDMALPEPSQRGHE